MGMLTDIYGWLLRRRTLTQPQTADDRHLRYQQLTGGTPRWASISAGCMTS
ncbi:hypothetical protein [Sodalis sp. (in: enterobacteria)]|uniref:hypothetical protein n=1 Tax=Sodalis sp. (in: enterobacteria) TaxID=1898979 RepID=UPI003F68780E